MERIKEMAGGGEKTTGEKGWKCVTMKICKGSRIF